MLRSYDIHLISDISKLSVLADTAPQTIKVADTESVVKNHKEFLKDQFSVLFYRKSKAPPCFDSKILYNTNDTQIYNSTVSTHDTFSLSILG